MAEDKRGCSCTGVFFSTALALGLIVGVGGYFAYKALKKQLDEVQAKP